MREDPPVEAALFFTRDKLRLLVCATIKFVYECIRRANHGFCAIATSAPLVNQEFSSARCALFLPFPSVAEIIRRHRAIFNALATNSSSITHGKLPYAYTCYV